MVELTTATREELVEEIVKLRFECDAKQKVIDGLADIIDRVAAISKEKQ